MHRAWVIVSLASLAACGGDSGGGGSAPILAKLYLLDGKGDVMTSLPEGSKVMIDGEEIDLASVQLLSSPPPPKSVSKAVGPHSLTVYVPGYGGFDDPGVDPLAGLTVNLVQRDLLNNLFVWAPTPGRVLVDPSAQGTFCVQGLTKLNASSALRFDVVLLVDTSLSTSRDSGISVDLDPENESILEVEIESLRRYVDALRGSVKIGVISFAGAAQPKVALTDDTVAVMAALDDIAATPPGGGTNFQGALEAAETMLTANPTMVTVTLEDANGVETERTVAVPRMVVFCTDGVPTLHNGAPAGTGLTQELADRIGALDGARSVVDNQIIVNAVAFGPDAATSRLTTLPAIAAITGGVYIQETEFLNMASDPTIFSFSDVVGVEVWNATAGETPAAASFSPDGVFSKTVDWRRGDNDIHVRLLTRVPSLTAEHSFNVKVLRKQDADINALVLDNTLKPLDQSNLRTPDGKKIEGTTLKELFLTGPNRVFNDLIELKGMESFQGLSGNAVTLKVVSEHAGYASDFGFVEFDPTVPLPATTHALLSNGTAFVVGKSGSWGNGSLNVFPADGPASATMTYAVTLGAGKSYAFFVIPGKTLANYLANPKVVAPVLTISKFNPNGGDHFLSYLSAAGRIGTTHGRTVVMALEDITTLDQSDRDYNDIVFSILMPATEASPEFAAPRCP
jgi:hypothetical protein